MEKDKDVGRDWSSLPQREKQFQHSHSQEPDGTHSHDVPADLPPPLQFPANLPPPQNHPPNYQPPQHHLPNIQASRHYPSEFNISDNSCSPCTPFASSSPLMTYQINSEPTGPQHNHPDSCRLSQNQSYPTVPSWSQSDTLSCTQNHPYAQSQRPPQNNLVSQINPNIPPKSHSDYINESNNHTSFPILPHNDSDYNNELHNQTSLLSRPQRHSDYGNQANNQTSQFSRVPQSHSGYNTGDNKIIQPFSIPPPPFNPLDSKASQPPPPRLPIIIHINNTGGPPWQQYGFSPDQNLHPNIIPRSEYNPKPTNDSLVQQRNDCQVQNDPQSNYHPNEQQTSHTESSSLTSPPPQKLRVPLISSKSLIENKDQEWLRQFEEHIMKRPLQPKTEITEERNIKVREVVQQVCEAERLVKELQSLEQQLADVKQGGEKAEWRDLVLQVHNAKEKLNKILARFQDKTFLQQAMKIIDQRRRKRGKAKARKKSMQEEKLERKRRRQEEEKKIDAWRERLKQEEDQQRREAVVKREADSVLGEVRQKQSEGRSMLEVLDKMAGLRRARLRKATAHGQATSSVDNQKFATCIARIEDVVKSQMKEYELEEHTLRVMLEGTASHKSAAKGRDLSLRYEDALKKVLFGESQRPRDLQTLESFTMADRCLETLVRRRQDWDQFTSNAEPPLATPIPLNWVLPPTQPSSEWARYLTPANTAH